MLEWTDLYQVGEALVHRNNSNQWLIKKLKALEYMKIQMIPVVLSAMKDALCGNHQSSSSESSQAS